MHGRGKPNLAEFYLRKYKVLYMYGTTTRYVEFKFIYMYLEWLQYFESMALCRPTFCIFSVLLAWLWLVFSSSTGNCSPLETLWEVEQILKEWELPHCETWVVGKRLEYKEYICDTEFTISANNHQPDSKTYHKEFVFTIETTMREKFQHTPLCETRSQAGMFQ